MQTSTDMSSSNSSGGSEASDCLQICSQAPPQPNNIEVIAHSRPQYDLNLNDFEVRALMKGQGISIGLGDKGVRLSCVRLPATNISAVENYTSMDVVLTKYHMRTLLDGGHGTIDLRNKTLKISSTRIFGAQPAGSPAPTLLTLPREIRNDIHDKLYAFGEGDICRSGLEGRNSGLLAACRQTRAEAMESYYRTTHFPTPIWGRFLLHEDIFDWILSSRGSAAQHLEHISLSHLYDTSWVKQ